MNFRVLILSLWCIIAAGCGVEMLTPDEAKSLDRTPAGADFEARFRPYDTPQFTLTRVVADAASSDVDAPVSHPLRLVEETVYQDGVNGSNAGHPDTFDLVTLEVRDTFGLGASGYCPPQSFCAKVKAESFSVKERGNVMAVVTSITDDQGQPMTGHDATNSSAINLLGLDATHGLWRHTGSGFIANSGYMAANPSGFADATTSGTSNWVFANPDDADTNYKIHIWAAPVYSSYTRSIGASTFVDACALDPAPSRATGKVTKALPFALTIFGDSGSVKLSGYGTSMSLSYGNDGVVVLGTIGLPGPNSVSLPSAAAAGPAAYVFWDKLSFNGAAGDTATSAMCFAVTGSAPNRVAIVEWKNMKFTDDKGTQNDRSHLTFEVKFFEGNDRVEYVYQTMTSATQAPRAQGSAAVVGLQNGLAASGAVGGYATIGSTKGGQSPLVAPIGLTFTPVQ